VQKEKSSWKKVNIITNIKGIWIVQILKNVADAVRHAAVIVKKNA
jgi:hypothetical protein